MVYQWDIERTRIGKRVLELWILSNSPQADVEDMAVSGEL